ncbi:microtubule associated protein (Ase1), putative [Galdieria sulphuraria]|uniref:Microtubule associated protein (Ase1), putative n=1 Tax=Galdieria sulphuraria TaxID=130081 RepID=M2XA57_GALSU|nr:microtubule associated protein (Ase1), putative [Galdieria sulphuraria]EME26757.1 microtubule associated protein (Ase1), putative [Galdieria sulphuraria]|eukprot:XP_005703277.1 microtubule associated protein (Ase1), putative [Galdieria sulphuraria]
METQSELQQLLGEAPTKKLLSLKLLWELEGLSEQETEQKLRELRQSLQHAFDQSLAHMKQGIESKITQLIQTCEKIQSISNEMQLSTPIFSGNFDLSAIQSKGNQVLELLTQQDMGQAQSEWKKKIQTTLPLPTVRETLNMVLEKASEWSAKREEKLQRIENKRQAIVNLWVDILGEVLDDLSEPFRESTDDASSAREEAMDKQYKDLCEIIDQRHHVMSESLQRIGAHLESLQIFNEEEMEDEVDRVAFKWRYKEENSSEIYKQLGITRDRMDILAAREEVLLQEVQERFQRLQNFRTQLLAYYEKLKFSMEEYEEFASQNANLSLSCLNAWEREVRRLEELEKERLQQLLDESKQRLHSLWNELQIPVSERLHWQETLDNEHLSTEKLIARHDEEISRLESFAEKVRPIYQLFERRQEILQKREAFMKESQDPSRLFGRSQDGSRRDAAFLLREEKLRKEIEKLPKIQENLKKKIKEFEATVQQKFLINGEPLLELLLEEEKREQEEKMEQRRKKEAERRARLEVESKYGTNATPELVRRVQSSGRKNSSRAVSRQQPEAPKVEDKNRNYLTYPSTPSSSKSNSTRSTSLSDKHLHYPSSGGTSHEKVHYERHTESYTPQKDENHTKKMQSTSRCHSPLSITSKTSVSRQHTFLAGNQEDSGESISHGEGEKVGEQVFMTQHITEPYSSQSQSIFRLPGVPVSSKISGYSKNSFKSSSSSSHSELTAAQQTYVRSDKEVYGERQMRERTREDWEELNDENRRPFNYQPSSLNTFHEVPSFVREVVSVEDAEESKFTCTESPINTTSTTTEGIQQ